jgi:hypothetical protein
MGLQMAAQDRMSKQKEFVRAVKALQRVRFLYEMARGYAS